MPRIAYGAIGPAKGGKTGGWANRGLAMLLLAVSMVAGACCVNAGRCGCCCEGYPVRASRETDLTAPGEGLSSIAASTCCGHLEIVAQEGKEVQVHTAVKVRADDDSRAKELAEQVQIKAERDGDKLNISPSLPKLNWRESITVDLHISVPWPMAASTQPATTAPASGPTRKLTCKTDAGAIDVHDVAAEVHAKTCAGKIMIRNVAGPVEAHCNAGAVEVRQVSAGVDAKSDTGRVIVAGACAPVRAETATGRIDISEVNAAASTSSQPAKAVWAHAATGSITIRKVTGNVEAHTATGKIVVTDVHGAVTARTAVGKVVTRNIDGPTEVSSFD